MAKTAKIINTVRVEVSHNKIFKGKTIYYLFIVVEQQINQILLAAVAIKEKLEEDKETTKHKPYNKLYFNGQT